MFWFWLNIPLGTLFFLAWVLIPLWLVIKHPDTGPVTLAWDERTADTPHPAATLGAGDYDLSRPQQQRVPAVR